MGRVQRRRGVGITIRKIAVDTQKQGKVTLISEKGFPAAGPALALKGCLGLREVEDQEIKLDVEESQLEEVDRPFRNHATHVFSLFNI